MSNKSGLVAEELQPNSEIDKWYPIGENFWLRRTTDHNYLCVQVFPFMEHSFLCYLHVLDITEFEKELAETPKQPQAPIAKYVAKYTKKDEAK